MRRFEFNGITFAKYQKYIFSTAEGLAEGSTLTQTANYLDQDGTDILTAYYEPRIVTLNGFILASNDTELYTLRKHLVSACNGKTKGILRYINGNKAYISEAVAELPQFGVKLKHSMPFSINFNLYNFYWKNDYKNIDYIFKLTNNIKGTFEFPFVFTTMTTVANVVNDGDVDCPLIIKITGIGSGTGGFEVRNNTTGKYIKLDYNLADGEVITIDTQELTITSSIAGNILHKITSDSTLDLKLAVGVNEIEGINYADNEIAITAEHHNLYVGV